MAPSRNSAPRLTDAELAEVLELIKGSDSVELKLSVAESDQRSAIMALGIDPLEAQIRQVIFFDTPDLTLSGHGVVVRARRIQGKGDDTVVKLRPVVPETLPAELRLSASSKVEVDAMPGGFVCSASLRGTPPKGADVRSHLAAGKPLRKLFSKEQRNFYAAHAPEGIGLDDLSMLGPIFVLKLNFFPEGFKRRLTGEMWLYPDGSRLLELSTKCPPAEAFQAAAEARAFLAGKGIDLSAQQETKTKKALLYFARLAKEAQNGAEAAGAAAEQAEAAAQPAEAGAQDAAASPSDGGAPAEEAEAVAG